jgi:Arc/MetJ-type ribon-helix-helix transcriptional regulator
MRTVSIPEPVAAAIERRVAATQFDSVDEYAAFALELLLCELDHQNDGDLGVAVDRVDTDEVRDRLDSLGYL